MPSQRDFVANFRQLSIFAYEKDTVVAVKNDDYKEYPVHSREDCLVLYGPPDTSCSRIPYKRFEIVLQNAMTQQGVEVNFSLCRFVNDKKEADKVFQVLVQNKFPTLCNNFPGLINAYSLRELVNYIRVNSEHNLAHFCAHFGYLDCLKLVIANQPSLKDAVDPVTQYTPLHLAVKGCRFPVVQYLVSCGADLSKTDNCGWNIFHFASTTNQDIISALCNPSESSASTTTTSSVTTTLSSGSHSNLNNNSNNGNSNNRSDHRKLITKLINSRNSEKKSPLYLACAADKPECIKELLKNGADFNGASLETIEIEKTSDFSLCNYIEQLDTKLMKMGGTPLHWAKSPKCMEAFIKMGCNINAKNFHGQTVLHCMVEKKDISRIVTLLSHGADVNASGPNEETPLHTAVRTEDVKIVRALINFGADSYIYNYFGEKPKDLIPASKRGENDELFLILSQTELGD